MRSTGGILLADQEHCKHIGNRQEQLLKREILVCFPACRLGLLIGEIPSIAFINSLCYVQYLL